MSEPTYKPLDLSRYEGHTPGPWKSEGSMSDRKITDTELDGLIAECFSPLIGELTDSRLGFALVELRDLRAENERMRAALDVLFRDCTDGGCMEHPEGILPTSHGHRHERVRDVTRRALAIRSAHETSEAREEGE